MSFQLFLVVKGSFSLEKDPLRLRHLVGLTDLWKFDMMHRRAGGDAARYKVVKHADAHKYCQGYSCGARSRGARDRSGAAPNRADRSSKITAWRKAKARANRAYLEEHVYGKRKEA